MDDDTLFDIIKKLIMKEHEAYEFYLKAASATTNRETKKLLEDFAAQELKHEHELEELYKKLHS